MIPEKDRAILKNLAERVAEIAALPIQKQTAAAWTQLNQRQRTKPLVWINEIPWHEMNVNDELTLQTTFPLGRQTEQVLRRTIYLWRHMRADMVVEPKFYSPLVIHDSGFGIEEDVHTIRLDARSDIVSREFHPQIQSEKDVAKIKDPVITHDETASEANFQTLQALFGDILPVEKCGIVHRWFAPWDELIRWWGVQEMMLDLVLRPELVHLVIDRLVNAYLARLEQWEKLNLLSLTPGNYRVGSGGLGYTENLPLPDFNPQRVRPQDQWGCATAQIFGDVSPEMHAEFALNYELRWLERFGMNYYGCCEPLHGKLHILAKIPNLRKISMSPWANIEKAAEAVGRQYVLSHKPNPAVLATDHWDVGQARQNLETVLERTRDSAIEIILKDISTVNYQPQRLWEWAEMASELTGKFG
jgi:hypothetical protein